MDKSRQKPTSRSDRAPAYISLAHPAEGCLGPKALPLYQPTDMLACIPRKRTSDQQLDEEVADQTQTRDRSDANLQAWLRAAWPSEPLLLITKYALCNGTHFTTSMSLLNGEGITYAGLLVITKYDVPASLVESLSGLQSPAAPQSCLRPSCASWHWRTSSAGSAPEQTASCQHRRQCYTLLL